VKVLDFFISIKTFKAGYFYHSSK